MATKRGGRGRNQNQTGGRGNQGTCGRGRKRDGSGPNYKPVKK